VSQTLKCATAIRFDELGAPALNGFPNRPALPFPRVTFTAGNPFSARDTSWSRQPRRLESWMRWGAMTPLLPCCIESAAGGGRVEPVARDDIGDVLRQNRFRCVVDHRVIPEAKVSRKERQP
jgi:hypothetical protein